MSMYHVTMSQGRADSFYLESSSKNKVLNFLNSFSTSVVRNIKQIVYSKHFNINYVKKPPFVSSNVFHKVVIFAYTENYSQQFTLYNVKKTVTQEQLETQYKKLFIVNEPIIGFFDISFYNEVSKSENIEYLFQVQYQRNSKTYTEDFYSDSYEKVKDFFETLIDGELLEIRKFIHLDNTIKKDDGEYLKRCNVYITQDGNQFSFSIPKLNKNINLELLKQSIIQNLSFNDKNIKNESIKLSFR